MADSAKASSTRRTSSDHSAEQQKILLKLLAAIAVMLGESPSAERTTLLLRDLADLPFYELRDVLSTWQRRHNWYPKPMEVREEVEARSEAEAEADFAVMSQWMLDNYDPDNGAMLWQSKSGARAHSKPLRGEWFPIKPLSPRLQNVIQVVGGYDLVFAALENDLHFPFFKRDFTAAWKREPEVQKVLRQRQLADGSKWLNRGSEPEIQSDADLLEKLKKTGQP
jgi:hypothetical protein